MQNGMRLQDCNQQGPGVNSNKYIFISVFFIQCAKTTAAVISALENAELHAAVTQQRLQEERRSVAVLRWWQIFFFLGLEAGISLYIYIYINMKKLWHFPVSSTHGSCSAAPHPARADAERLRSILAVTRVMPEQLCGCRFAVKHQSMKNMSHRICVVIITDYTQHGDAKTKSNFSENSKVSLNHFKIGPKINT